MHRWWNSLEPQDRAAVICYAFFVLYLVSGWAIGRTK